MGTSPSWWATFNCYSHWRMKGREKGDREKGEGEKKNIILMISKVKALDSSAKAKALDSKTPAFHPKL
ncbi:hypothetical protein BGP_2920 [Beggiatoa sp. PS]|nr:hypothetical protein BGP_2920 [Beggiatoa sp. PS]